MTLPLLDKFNCGHEAIAEPSRRRAPTAEHAEHAEQIPRTLGDLCELGGQFSLARFSAREKNALKDDTAIFVFREWDK